MRRQNMYEMTNEEIAIQKIIWDIEKLGADVLLTESQQLLLQAKDKLSDFVDKEIAKESNEPLSLNETFCLI